VNVIHLIVCHKKLQHLIEAGISPSVNNKLIYK